MRLSTTPPAALAAPSVVLGAALLTLALPSVADGPSSPQDVARAYFDATAGRDLSRADALFAKESLIFETGGVEGTWTTYRDHHLAPELAAIRSFDMDLAPPAQVTTKISADQTLALVAWPIAYKIALSDGRTISSKGAVSFVLERANRRAPWRIAHLHWSSRKNRGKGESKGHESPKTPRVKK